MVALPEDRFREDAGAPDEGAGWPLAMAADVLDELVAQWHEVYRASIVRPRHLPPQALSYSESAAALARGVERMARHLAVLKKAVTDEAYAAFLRLPVRGDQQAVYLALHPVRAALNELQDWENEVRLLRVHRAWADVAAAFPGASVSVLACVSRLAGNWRLLAEDPETPLPPVVLDAPRSLLDAAYQIKPRAERHAACLLLWGLVALAAMWLLGWLLGSSLNI